jgi:hypothetical protein
VSEALQRINAAVARARSLEAELRPQCQAGLPNDIARAQGESGALQLIRELLEEELPFDMIDHADLHYGLILDEEREVGESAPGRLAGLEVTVVGVNRHVAPPVVMCHLEGSPPIEFPVKLLKGQCGICARRLDPNAEKGDPALDCGGHCNGCMAEAEGREL